ncbi:uncharacterized protein H6S33_010931 [Morchella sextelata]|uniref:uncharacterized protein n=1 Tax=Morchella sextelata TaxID=1174677 RepID=UPI001D0453B7|nr:uncharacterized protein H6S33_010931 [Morchella sextelata]KAH0611666.1 hypothetical protein H6S33_010931 [Morchella sextelata]
MLPKDDPVFFNYHSRPLEIKWVAFFSLEFHLPLTLYSEDREFYTLCADNLPKTAIPPSAGSLVSPNDVQNRRNMVLSQRITKKRYGSQPLV